MAVIVDQSHGFKPFARSQRCRLQSFTQFDYSVLELGQQTNFAHSLKRAVEAAHFHRSISTPCLSLSNNVEEEIDTTARVEIVGGHRAPRIRALVVEVAIAMASGVSPMPLSNGLGGAYILRGRNGENIAVAKPIDEEPLAFNNPKGFVGQMLGQPGLKRSVRVGETGIRESAAYLLDHEGFAGVPPTALVKFSHVTFHVNNEATISISPYKIASLQRFADHDSDAGDLGPSCFSVVSVHRIGILDVRLLNLDRHAGNILVKNHEHVKYAVGKAELIPIDHGFCLPEWLDDPYFEWLLWPQASIPFSESEVEYISNLDPFKDAELLRDALPSLQESSIRVLVLCTIFLKQAAAAGLCLADIGQMMTRESSGGEESFSVLENVCLNVKDGMSKTSSKISDEDDYQGDDSLDIKMFQFDEENSNGAFNLPQLIPRPPEIAKPPKIPRFSCARSMSGLPDVVLSPLNEENDQDEDDCNLNAIKESGAIGDDDNSSSGSCKVGTFTRSMSFSEPNFNHEAGGISFGDMSEGEWQSFLEMFEKVLPQAFEGSKSLGLKQRLGTSCKF